MRLDAYASQPNYRDHVLSVHNALSAPFRGEWLSIPLPGTKPVLVASQGDLARMRAMGRDVVLMEHGAGQSYGGGSPHAAQHPAYPGGILRDAAAILSPNEYAAARDRQRLADVYVVGSPRVEALRQIPFKNEGAIAVSAHWPSMICPEAGWAFPEYRAAIRDLAKTRKVLGHAHPRIFESLEPWFRAVGIEPVRSFEEVVSRATLYVADNSSTLFEFGALDRPVVILNSKRYRRDVEHGGRFWDWSTVGVNVESAADLGQAVESALADAPDLAAARRAVIAEVYPHQSSRYATDVLEKWLGEAYPDAEQSSQATATSRSGDTVRVGR